MDDRILTERAGDVVTLRLNTPAAMNALDGDMAEDLHARLVGASESARAVVLAGHERAFCAGANLASRDRPENAEAGIAGTDMGERLESSFNPLMLAIKACPVPVISAVRGAAAGIGASIALCCDMIVAGESAYFLQAFRRIGLVPDGGSAFLLAHSVGRLRAMELMLLGEKLPARTALEWGLINRVVADDAVEATAAALAAALASGPTKSLGLIRQAAWAALAHSFEAQLGAERILQREAGTHADFVEGVAAFLGKREARFTGR